MTRLAEPDIERNTPTDHLSDSDFAASIRPPTPVSNSFSRDFRTAMICLAGLVTAASNTGSRNGLESVALNRTTTSQSQPTKRDDLAID